MAAFFFSNMTAMACHKVLLVALDGLLLDAFFLIKEPEIAASNVPDHLSVICLHEGVSFHFYADDTQIYVHLRIKMLLLP